eukprot:1317300-Amorphochlora_amoeboformis.AAC.1
MPGFGDRKSMVVTQDDSVVYQYCHRGFVAIPLLPGIKEDGRPLVTKPDLDSKPYQNLSIFGPLIRL